MAAKVSDSGISIDLTLHTAQADGNGDWTVPRLPGRSPTHSQAATTEAGAESPAEALDGSERKLLLSHLARTYPDVVEAGVAWLAEYHEAARERQRAARRRREHDKRQRQRAARGDRG
jgi:hypothetical protein